MRIELSRAEKFRKNWRFSLISIKLWSDVERKTVELVYVSALPRKERWNRSILAESSIYCSISYWRSEKKPISLYWRQLWWKMWLKEKKEEIWLSPMTKAPTPTEMSKGQSDNTNNATKKFD